MEMSTRKHLSASLDLFFLFAIRVHSRLFVAKEILFSQPISSSSSASAVKPAVAVKFNTSMNNQFRYYLRVRYGECDAQKVVFNARYADYVDITVMEFLRSMGYEQALVDATLDYQLVKQTLEWKSPARFDQVLEVSMYAKHLGNTSFTLAADFRIAGDERVIVTVETVYVLVEHKTLKKRSLPNDLRASLENGAQGMVVDHAGYVGA
jgi:acyl-CoA thioester hydrolase